MKKLCLFSAITVLLQGTPSFDLHAATVAVPSIADTGNFEDHPDNNLGSATTVSSGSLAGRGFPPRVGRSRMLVKFDVSGFIPAGAIVTDASMRLSVTRRPFTGGVASIFGIHRLLADWGEGNKAPGFSTGIGAQATAGEATWNHRFFSTDTWNSAGGTAGIDYVAASSGNISINNLADYQFGPTATLAADVQGWIDNPASNFGYILISQGEGTLATARRFATRENSVATIRPVLNVTFAKPLQIGNVNIINNNFRFTFEGAQGTAYQVEANSDLSNPAGWITISNLPPLNFTGPVFIADPLGNTARFYRVVAN